MPSVSKTQQRLFGQAYGVKEFRSSRGKKGINPKDLNPKYKEEILKLANSMSLNKLKDFANTKHKNIPEQVEEGAIKDIYQRLQPEAKYNPKKKKQRAVANLADYREFIIKDKSNKMEESKQLNEDCGCGGKSAASPYTASASTYAPDPYIGMTAKLVDGRNGVIDDSIRNSTGEVIGYVMYNERGTFRVFRDKVAEVYESGAMASVATTPGMGNVSAPTQTSTGSGDQFPSLTAGTPAAKKTPKKKEEKTDNNKVMSWKDFKKNMVKNQTKS
jgi:hypothetical protein